MTKFVQWKLPRVTIVDFMKLKSCFSYSFQNHAGLQLKWGQPPMDLSPKLEMLQFHVKSIDADICENLAIDGLFSGLPRPILS